MDEIENAQPLWGEIPKSPNALIDPPPPSNLFCNLFNHPSKDQQKDMRKGAEKGTGRKLIYPSPTTLRSRKARAMDANREPLWGETLGTPALTGPRLPASLFGHHFGHVLKLQEDIENEAEGETGKGLIDNNEPHGTLAPPKKKLKRLPFQEIRDSALNAPTHSAGISGRLAQENDEIDLHYANDLYIFYKHQENVHRPVDYMANQPGINSDIRASLVSLLTVAHHELHLQPETLHLAVYIVDRFLSLHSVTRRQLHVIGMSSLLVATKYEEDWVPKVHRFLTAPGCYYTRQELCFWEKTILEKLEWYLTVPTVFMFLVRFVKVANADEELEHMIYFYGELGLMEYRLIMYSPSMVAASTVYAARCALNKSPRWTHNLQRDTSYAESQLLECAKILTEAHIAAAPHGKRKMKMVYKKYLNKKFGAVARYPPAMNLIEASKSSCVAPDAQCIDIS